MFSKFKIVAVFFFGLSLYFMQPCYSQDSIDERAWLSQNLRFPFAEKWKVDLRPIVRISDGISKLSNISFDVSVGYKLDKNVSFSILSRTFYFQERKPLRFMFFDTRYTFNKEDWKLTFSSLLRGHLAFDAHGFDEPDFLRIDQSIKYKVDNKFSTFIAFEPWMKLNDKFEMGRARYKVGAIYQIRKASNINLQYWRQQSYNAEISRLEHMIVFTILHTIVKDK